MVVRCLYRFARAASVPVGALGKFDDPSFRKVP